MKKKVLITGVAGLFGSHISRYFVSKGYDVIGIDNLFGGYLENLDPAVKFHEFDLRDSNLLENLTNMEKPEFIIHFAAYAAEGLSHYIRNFNYSNNLLATTNIINSAINNNVKKIIFASSMAVYGDKYAPPFTEDMIPAPIDPYGIAKYASELDLKNAKEHFGLDYSIIRPHNVVGIYQNIWDKYRNVLGIWIREAITKNPITIFGDGNQKRAFSDIAFYCEPIETLLDSHSGEIFNLGSDKDFTILETAKIFQKCANKFGYFPDLRFEEERKEAKYAYSSHKKAKSLLNFNDDTELEKVINEMFKWALTLSKKPIKKLDYEINKNMYSFWEK